MDTIIALQLDSPANALQTVLVEVSSNAKVEGDADSTQCNNGMKSR
jgi:hypothetical protein